MTREEAALKLSFHLMQCGMLMPIGWVDENGKGSELFEAFKMAQDALREQPRWISVEERLPTRADANPNESVLAIAKDDGFARAWIWDIVDRYYGEFTYWMPWPEPPTEEEV